MCFPFSTRALQLSQHSSSKLILSLHCFTTFFLRPLLDNKLRVQWTDGARMDVSVCAFPQFSLMEQRLPPALASSSLISSCLLSSLLPLHPSFLPPLTLSAATGCFFFTRHKGAQEQDECAVLAPTPQPPMAAHAYIKCD